MEKSILKSKTFWSNLAMALLPLFPGAGDVIKENPEAGAAVFALVNVILRVISKDKVYIR